MKNLLSILVGAVVAAAFLGPGTITTAASAGASYGPTLLFTLVFATFACLVLQEASARLTIASELTLARALRRRYASGFAATVVLVLVLAAIVIGCAAYEAGNILGGVAGAGLATELDRRTLTLISVALAGALLWNGSTRTVVTVLGALVGVMGIAFLWTALQLGPDWRAVAGGMVMPRLPEGSGLLALGLIGTTVVPYNLFLGSGLARGQDLRRARIGLVVAIGLGGVISMAVLLVGTAAAAPFSFAGLAEVLAQRLGPWAAVAFGWGLFAAGFSSAVTAPLAAALTARGLFASGQDGDGGDGGESPWGDRGWCFRAVWAGVLLTGALFGLLDVRPVPVIILAQAANGVLLPLVALFLFVVVNDRQLLGDAVNGILSNLAMVMVMAVAILLGCRGVLRALAATGAPLDPAGPALWGLSAAVLALAAAWAFRELRVRDRK